MKKWGLFTMAMMFALSIIAGCQSDEASNAESDAASEVSYEDVDTEEAKALIDEQKVEVLDVRTEEEFEQGHIPNAKLIPVDELGSRLDELEKDQAYLVVCRSGNRSSQASKLLVDNGFSEIYNMEKGMNDWSYEVE